MPKTVNEELAAIGKTLKELTRSTNALNKTLSKAMIFAAPETKENDPDIVVLYQNDEPCIVVSNRVRTRAIRMGNPIYATDPEYVRTMIDNQRLYFNDILHSRGWLTMEQVRNALCLAFYPEDILDGWVYDGDESNVEIYVTVCKDDDGEIEYLLHLNYDTNIYGRLVKLCQKEVGHEGFTSSED